MICYHPYLSRFLLFTMSWRRGGNVALGLFSCRSGYRTPSKCIHGSRNRPVYSCLFPLAIIPFSFKKYVLENITQSQQPNQPVVLIYDNQAMHPRFSYCVKDRIKAVINVAGVDSWEVLQFCQHLLLNSLWNLQTSCRL